MVPFEDVAERIVERLTQRRRAQAQKDWLSRISVPA